MTGAGFSSIPRVALTIDEAAASLGVSRDHFERHVMRQVRVIYTGRRRLVPVGELERWANRQATVPMASARRTIDRGRATL